MKKYLLIPALLLVGCSTNSSSQSPSKAPVKINEHRVVETNDISYAGCKRVSYAISVPDESLSGYAEETMQQIINSKKPHWDDITVWAYRYSEEPQIGSIPYTLGMKEYSTCD